MAIRGDTGAASGIRNLGVQPQFSAPGSIPPGIYFTTHAAMQHKKIHSNQFLRPCWKNRPTLKLWRESPDSERKSRTIPSLHHQGFWHKASKYSGISKPTQG
jgi:hypothetical protein